MREETRRLVLEYLDDICRCQEVMRADLRTIIQSVSAIEEHMEQLRRQLTELNGQLKALDEG